MPPEQAGDPSAHKSEGAFYIWTDAEIGAVTGGDAAIVRRRFGIEPDGNAPQDPQGEFTGRNLLYIAQTIDDDRAPDRRRRPRPWPRRSARARAKLFAVREHRPRPHLDDKVLTAWNGLMIAAFARAARVLAGRATAARYLAAGRQRRRRSSAGRCGRVRAAAPAPLPRRRGRDRRLRRGLRLPDLRPARAVSGRRRPRVARVGDDAAGRAGRLFWDEADAGWFSTTGHDPSVLLRLKEDYDGAEPAAGFGLGPEPRSRSSHSSVAARGSKKAERTLARFGPQGGRGRPRRSDDARRALRLARGPHADRDRRAG